MQVRSEQAQFYTGRRVPAKHRPCWVALHFLYYNFGRVHKTLRVTRQWNLGLRIMSGALKKLRPWQVNYGNTLDT